MSSRSATPKVHLICQAHIDPIWIWDWEEGFTEALATFEVAADLLDAYPEFVFNHNESVLYAWTKELKPELFARIKRHVKDGRWVISGGWFLQPDCNLPSGESFARQILLGCKFFRDELGAVPKVAYNLDSFGHHGNMPQFLKLAGYETYVHFRPMPWEKPLEDHIYRWRGVDGTEIAALRPPCIWYCTHPGDTLLAKIENMRKLALERKRHVTAFWGAGNHGGGATRAELEAVRTVLEQSPEAAHSSLEQFARDHVLPHLADKPVTQGELQKCFTGCYTSIMGIKQANRRGEGLALAAERYAALAWWLLDESYPAETLESVWQDVLFNQFHDIIAGSVYREGARSSAEMMGRASTNAREVMLRAQTALTRSTENKKPLTIRLLNPHPEARRVPAMVHAQLATHPYFVRGKHIAVFDAENRLVTRQLLAYRRNTAEWRSTILFEADLPAMGIAEYRIEVQGPEFTKEQLEKLPESHTELQDASCPVADHSPWHKVKKKAIHVVAQSYSASVCRKTGRLISLVNKESGAEMLGSPSGRLLVREDNNDAWGGTQLAYGTEVGAFELPSKKDLADIAGQYGAQEPAPAVRVVASGPLLTVVEVVLAYRRSTARLRYLFHRNFPNVDIELLLQWNERRRALQYEFATAVDGPQYAVEIPHAAIVRPRGNGEEPAGRWSMLFNEELAFALVNDGPGGLEVTKNVLRQTLVRTPSFVGGNQVPNPGFIQEHMDLGEHLYQFKLAFGPVAGVRAQLPMLADDLTLPFSYHVSLPLNASAACGLPRGEEPVRLESEGQVHLEAMKQSEDGRALIVRLAERGGAPAKATLHLQHAKSAHLQFTPYEMKTLRFERGAEAVECNLLEEPLV